MRSERLRVMGAKLSAPPPQRHAFIQRALLNRAFARHYPGGVPRGRGMRLRLIIVTGLSVLAGGSGEPSHPYIEQTVKTCHEFSYYGQVEQAGCFTRVDTAELASSPASEFDLTGDAAIVIGDSDKAIEQFDRSI